MIPERLFMILERMCSSWEETNAIARLKAESADRNLTERNAMLNVCIKQAILHLDQAAHLRGE